MTVSHRSLEDLLGSVESPVELLRNSQAGPNVYPGCAGRVHELARRAARLAEDVRPLQPVATTWPTWPWRAPTRSKLLSHLAVNSFAGFAVDKAKHFVPCTPDGYVIGDVILFALAENALQPRRPRARAELDHLPRGDGRLRRRGRARPADGAAHRRAPPLVPLPGAGPERDAGDREGARRAAAGAAASSTMTDGARSPGGPSGRCATAWPASRAGSSSARGTTARRCTRRSSRRARSSGMRKVGGRAYSSNTLESGLDPLAAAGRLLRRGAEGLPRVAAGRRLRGIGRRSAAASSRPTIEDYYFTPWDLGYGNYVKFDHDFVGREALERHGRRRAPARR